MHAYTEAHAYKHTYMHAHMYILTHVLSQSVIPDVKALCSAQDRPVPGLGSQIYLWSNGVTWMLGHPDQKPLTLGWLWNQSAVGPSLKVMCRVGAPGLPPGLPGWKQIPVWGPRGLASSS